jgi:hypothetical protein
MGYNTVASYAFDRWTHVRLLVRGQQAELYVDDMQQPLTFIRELLMNINSGMLGLKSGAGGVWFSNFTYRPDPQITFQTKPDGYTVSTPAGTESSFEVSDPFRENLFQDVNELRPEQLQRFTWKELKAEKSGLANISRLYPVTDSNTVFVKITVRSAKDMIKRLDLGYSDRIKVYCNNTALFSGQQNFRSRDFRYLGTIGYFESVYLPLKKGDNSILLAVSETFGGWGIMAKWDNMDGLN